MSPNLPTYLRKKNTNILPNQLMTHITTIRAWRTCPLLETAVSHPISLSSVSQKKSPLKFLAFFPNVCEFFRPNFACLLHLSIYARLQIFIYLSATLTKLCHIKREHPVHIIRAKCQNGQNTCWHFLTFFQNSWEFLVRILHIYYTFLSTLEYKLLFHYLQL